MGQADPILTRLGAGPAVKKLVETALALSSSPDPQQRNHAYSFMESAIKELEDEEKTREEKMGQFGDEDELHNAKLKEENDEDKEKRLYEQDDERQERKIHEEEDDDNNKERKIHEEEDEKNEHKVHEEVLDNHNLGARTTGSEQSTENREPYTGEGKDTTNGEKPMQDMDGTVNQWSETNGMIVNGLPPDMMGAGLAPDVMGSGLAPDIAQEMGAQMPPLPQLNDNQMMRQMQYTVNNVVSNLYKKEIVPMKERLNATIRVQRETIREQKNAIKALAIELRETKTTSGNMKLDLDTMRQNATATFRETEQLQGFTSPAEIQSVTGVQPLPNYQRNKVAIARSEIEQMDKMLNSNKNPMYN